MTDHEPGVRHERAVQPVEVLGGGAPVPRHALADGVLLAMPLRVLCKVECAGLCAICGADLNSQTCSCVVETVDERWSALRDLL